MMPANKITEKLRSYWVLLRMMKWFVNWKEIWRPYFSNAPLPTLQLRCGLNLHHTIADGPVALVLEIFADECYSQHFDFPREGVVLDIGANIGAFTLYCTKKSDKLFIHAYEPNPKTNETLRHNIIVNGKKDRVRIYDEAVGRVRSDFRMWTNVPSVIASGYGTTALSDEEGSITVPMIDLNEVVDRIGQAVELLKIDIEGAEADLLEGATHSTLSKIKCVALEYHDYLCAGALTRCKSVLEASGFVCQVRPSKRDHDKLGLLYARRKEVC
ncbi:MAG TPA: FkbM family methyltransferase [Blastocatellia bacterium]|nr:FkbM family methyltransferase [Blastocatellia bacterium]